MYSYHVTQAGRNRVKMLDESSLSSIRIFLYTKLEKPSYSCPRIIYSVGVCCYCPGCPNGPKSESLNTRNQSLQNCCFTFGLNLVRLESCMQRAMVHNFFLWNPHSTLVFLTNIKLTFTAEPNREHIGNCFDENRVVCQVLLFWRNICRMTLFSSQHFHLLPSLVLRCLIIIFLPLF